MKSENICHKYFFTFFASLVIFERLLFADMDMKVSMMIRLLEEDGDSFAKKAEMYFQKRPELLKLVEEFYRAYRALAERYDHATVALKQAHRTIQEAFPNQIPSTPTDASNSASSDDLQKEAYDVDAPNIVSIKSNSKARKVLNFLEEDGKGYDRADLNYKIEGENGEAISLECQKFSEKISNLELEISRAQEENEKINSELERCLIFEQKVNVLTKQMNERGEEIETLKHRSKEADLKNCSLIEDLHKFEEQNENLSKELRSNQEELEEERILKVKAEEALKSSEKLNLSHQRELTVLFSDLQMKSENLSDLEDKVEKLEVENQSLTAQLLSSTSTIKNLQDEISTLNVTLIRLEEEAKERENEMATLQQKIMVSQGESSDLELKLKCIVDQILGIGLSEESFQVSVRGIQTENQELKESCEKNEDE